MMKILSIQWKTPHDDLFTSATKDNKRSIKGEYPEILNIFYCIKVPNGLVWSSSSPFYTDNKDITHTWVSYINDFGT